MSAGWKSIEFISPVSQILPIKQDETITIQLPGFLDTNISSYGDGTINGRKEYMAGTISGLIGGLPQKEDFDRFVKEWKKYENSSQKLVFSLKDHAGGSYSYTGLLDGKASFDTSIGQVSFPDIMIEI